MPDLLVRLYDLPLPGPALERATEAGFEIRRALAPEKHVVARWIRQRFPKAWESECEIAFSRVPIACFLAIREGRLFGFAAYEATCRNFFGPIGVDESCRGRSVGGALLLSVLHAMRAEGYAYAIIGDAGATEFFGRTAGAMPIHGSSPGIYRGLLRKNKAERNDGRAE